MRQAAALKKRVCLLPRMRRTACPPARQQRRRQDGPLPPASARHKNLSHWRVLPRQVHRCLRRSAPGSIADAPPELPASDQSGFARHRRETRLNSCREPSREALMLAAEFLHYSGGSHPFIIARTVEANGKGSELAVAGLRRQREKRARVDAAAQEDARQGVA